MLMRKDFRTIAGIIKKSYSKPYGMIVGHDFINDMADYLATKNPAFDRHKFNVACGAIDDKVTAT